jgi:two-component system nitrogen regulation response regulator GlnG
MEQGDAMVTRSGLTALPAARQKCLIDLTGNSIAIQQISRQIERVARTNFTIIVQGETGTGKELVAHMIHERSPRGTGPFVAIDCGAIPESLVESELFGYVRGAFTGAEGKKAGYFELARGGTLFLDEIANLPLAVQVKLLRGLQERRVFPLGSERSVTTDVRIIVASNVVLEDEVRAGRFRADLFHRLNEFKIVLVPLRDRPEDIPILAERFVQETHVELGKTVQGFSEAARQHLQTYDWPGNVRELRNTIRRAVLLSDEIVELKHVRQILSTSTSSPPAGLQVVGRPPPANSDSPRPVPSKSLPYVGNILFDRLPPGGGLHDMIREATVQIEKAVIQQVLQEVKGNKSAAAKRLKIGYKTLFRKLKAYDLLH